MKAIRTKPGRARNPLFSVEERRRKKAAGEPYETAEFIELPIGEELDDPDCWRLCVKGMAVPADDECKKKLFDYLGEPGRKQLLENIRLTQKAAQQNALGPEDAKLLKAMEKAYAFELQLTDPDKPAEDKAVAFHEKPAKVERPIPGREPKVEPSATS